MPGSSPGISLLIRTEKLAPHTRNATSCLNPIGVRRGDGSIFHKPASEGHRAAWALLGLLQDTSGRVGVCWFNLADQGRKSTARGLPIRLQTGSGCRPASTFHKRNRPWGALRTTQARMYIGVSYTERKGVLRKQLSTIRCS